MFPHPKSTMFPHPKFRGLTNPTPPQIHLISILKSILHGVGYAIEE